MRKSKHQTFIVEQMKRSDIHLADYNPRIINDYARRELKKKIKKVGLVEPLIINRRTGHLVSGHQRISILDQLENYKPGESDYSLDISVIDVDEKTEKELNVFLNNPSTQGEWNLDALKGFFDEIDFQDMGFTMADVTALTGDFFQPDTVDTKPATETKDQLAAIKDARKKGQEKMAEADNVDYYLVVVCQDQADKDDLAFRLGLPIGMTYVKAAELRNILGLLDQR